MGKLPENVEESDVQKLFPKATKIDFKPAKSKPKGVRLPFAFVTFPDEKSAADVMKLGSALKLKDTPIKATYLTTKKSANTADED